jgi:ribosomal protein S21
MFTLPGCARRAHEILFRVARLHYCLSMKRLFVLAAFALLAATRATAQTSLDVIIQDLREVKQQHDQAASQAMTTFLGSLDAASQSGAQALDLYKRAGGNLPDLTPVRHHYEYETPTEKEAREAQDAQNYAAAAIVVQVHCGLMRYAALLTLKPAPPGIQDQWLTWLKTISQVYPQLAGSRALKDVPMRDSVVSNYLQFRGWGNSEQGGWAVHDIPRLYRDLVLEPLRHPPGPGTLDAWDTYTNMVQADESDHDKWASVDEPPIDFDRGADDFAIEPTLDKLATLDAIIKANPTSDHLNDWITRMTAMIKTYQQGGTNHAQMPAPTPGTPSSDATSIAPAPTAGTPSAGTAAPLPAATPSAPAAGTVAPTPAATP